jgi:hypothetical protein
MDINKLRARITFAELHIGDIKDTLPRFIELSTEPIGAIVFDMDLYTPTKCALDVLATSPSDKLLPRVICCFDEVYGSVYAAYNKYAGELLAINEFNDHRAERKLDIIRNGFGVSYKEPWHDKMYIMHLFDNAKYNELIRKKVAELPLR